MSPAWRHFLLNTYLCGGVVFRSGNLQHDPRLYYFYICQDGQYDLVRYAENVSDPTINPNLISEKHSPYILVGSGQINFELTVGETTLDLCGQEIVELFQILITHVSA